MKGKLSVERVLRVVGAIKSNEFYFVVAAVDTEYW